MRLRALFPALLLAACAGVPPPPAWQAEAHGALKAFESAYLLGRSRVAEQEFARARAALAATGRPDLVARAELRRCAARVASLAGDDCPGFRALAADATGEERAYAAFLAGELREADPRLPAHHRPVAAGDAAALAAIADPFARLVAAGVLFRQGRLPPQGIALATETASAEGWRRPLLAWLGVQEQRSREAGDVETAGAIARRRALVAGEDR